MIIIRYANQDDATTIVNFNSAMAIETENKQLDSNTVNKGVNEILNNSDNGFYLIAESNSVPVGQLMLTKEWSDWRNGEFWWIQSVYVHPDNRGKGIYKQLYNEVTKLAKTEKNVCGIRLYVDKANTIAQQVYAKSGMEESKYLLFEEEWSSE